MLDNTTIPLAILRVKQLSARTGLSRSAIYDKLNPKSPRHDPAFPIQVKIGFDAVGWLASEVEVWLASRPRTRLIEKPEVQ